MTAGGSDPKRQISINPFGFFETIDAEKQVVLIHLTIAAFCADEAADCNDVKRPCAVPSFGIAIRSPAKWVDATGVLTFVELSLDPYLLLDGTARCRDTPVFKAIAQLAFDTDDLGFKFVGRLKQIA